MLDLVLVVPVDEIGKIGGYDSSPEFFMFPNIEIGRLNRSMVDFVSVVIPAAVGCDEQELAYIRKRRVNLPAEPQVGFDDGAEG